MSGLQLANVEKAFGDVKIIRGVDLSIAPGEFTVFVGPSGCGKSTLLRLIAGLEQATGGTIRIGEQDVTDLEPAQRGVAMVFQSYALYPHMTVAENMGFGLKMNGAPKAEIDERVAGAAKILHLEHLLARKPKQLSGGQRQRVAIGRAIVRKPKVFLFDEPLSNLDAELRVAMRLEIARLHRQLGATMIYVTHDQVEAMTLADKIVVLRAGKIEQTGSPLALYDDPDNIFVAGFIGSPQMNFVEAEVVAHIDGGVELSLPEFDNTRVSLVLKQGRPAIGQKVSLGVRPEHFDPAGSVKLSARVDVIEHLGSASYAYAAGPGSDKPLTIELRDRLALKEGDVVQAGFDPAKAFLFDKETGLRIR